VHPPISKRPRKSSLGVLFLILGIPAFIVLAIVLAMLSANGANDSMEDSDDDVPSSSSSTDP
jgi:hypothetical protein